MEINKCECGKLIPLKNNYCAECSAELDSWFWDDLFELTKDFEDA